MTCKTFILYIDYLFVPIGDIFASKYKANLWFLFKIEKSTQFKVLKAKK